MLDDERVPRPELLAALPIFPLPNAVLLPGIILPLNVFEPRYLDLVEHALAHGQLVGVPLLRPGYEASYAGRPEVEPIFGVGRIISHQSLPDGRRFIRLEGMCRARVVSELDPRATFREVRVELLPEDEPSDPQTVEVLRAQLERVSSAVSEDDREIMSSVLRIGDPRVFVYAIAAVVPTLGLLPHSGRETLLAMQQQCLAAQTADERIDVLFACLAQIVESLDEMDRLPKAMLN